MPQREDECEDPRLHDAEGSVHSGDGDKEAAAGAVSVRVRGKGDQGSMPLAEFLEKAKGAGCEQGD